MSTRPNQEILRLEIENNNECDNFQGKVKIYAMNSYDFCHLLLCFMNLLT